jgi:hypothetical protein
MSVAQLLSGTPAVLGIQVPQERVTGLLGGGSDVSARLQAIEAQLVQISAQISQIDAYLRALNEAIALEARPGETAAPGYP